MEQTPQEVENRLYNLWDVSFFHSSCIWVRSNGRHHLRLHFTRPSHPPATLDTSKHIRVTKPNETFPSQRPNSRLRVIIPASNMDAYVIPAVKSVASSNHLVTGSKVRAVLTRARPVGSFRSGSSRPTHVTSRRLVNKS